MTNPQELPPQDENEQVPKDVEETKESVLSAEDIKNIEEKSIEAQKVEPKNPEELAKKIEELKQGLEQEPSAVTSTYQLGDNISSTVRSLFYSSRGKKPESTTLTEMADVILNFFERPEKLDYGDAKMVMLKIGVLKEIENMGRIKELALKADQKREMVVNALKRNLKK